MPAMVIRDIDDALKKALRLRAAEHGHSMEEEVRQILRTVLSVPEPEDQRWREYEELEAASKSR